MTADQRKKLAGELRESLGRARKGQSSVYMSQFHAGLLLDLLDSLADSESTTHQEDGNAA